MDQGAGEGESMMGFVLAAGILAPPIVSRADWGAKPVGPKAVGHSIRRITIHHTGVKQNPARTLEDKLRGLQSWSQREDKLASGKTKPAWPDIPYHYYIAVDGRIGEGREWQYVGDTNTEYNPAGHLLIVVEGDFTQEKLLAVQWDSLRQLTLWCASEFRVPPHRIEAHLDFAQTTCPGPELYSRMGDLRNAVRLGL